MESSSSMHKNILSPKVNKQNKSNKKRLSLTPNVLDKHPSALHLDNILNKEPAESFKGVNVISSSSSQEMKIKEDLKSDNYNFILNEVEHAIYSESDNFYIRQEPMSITIEDETFQKKKKIKKKHSLMTPQEDKLDKEITKCIKKGKHYSHIEDKLSDLLKK